MFGFFRFDQRHVVHLVLLHGEGLQALFGLGLPAAGGGHEGEDFAVTEIDYVAALDVRADAGVLPRPSSRRRECSPDGCELQHVDHGLMASAPGNARSSSRWPGR